MASSPINQSGRIVSSDLLTVPHGNWFRSFTHCLQWVDFALLFILPSYFQKCQVEMADMGDRVSGSPGSSRYCLKSPVWKHMIRLGPGHAQCKTCLRKLSNSGNTTNLWNHLKIHNIYKPNENSDQMVSFVIVLIVLFLLFLAFSVITTFLFAG